MTDQPVAFFRAMKWLRPISAIIVFAFTLAVRIRGVSDHFWLLGDQIRDWGIAMRPFADLPLVGPPTHVGGYTIGPAFYWILWTIRVVLGPWFDNLPHAGGIGQAALQSAADAILLIAIWQRTQSPWIALTTVLLVATSSFDLSLAALVWNPTMGTALAKIATATVLLDWHRGSAVRAATAAALAWIAVHAYTGAIFVAVGVFTAFLVDPLVRGDRRLARRNTFVIAAVVALLQLPYLAHQFIGGRGQSAMGAVTFSVWRVLSGESPPELAKSVRGYASAVHSIQVSPWTLAGAGWGLLLCCGIVAVRRLHDPSLLAVTLLPQLAAIAGYSLFLDDLDSYYYLSLMPAAVLSVTLAATAMPSQRIARAVGATLFVLALFLVPERLRYATTMFRMPEYRVLRDASRKIWSLHQPIRAIQTDFQLPPSSSPEFLFEILGGRIDRQSSWVCVIRSDGNVLYRQVAGS